MAGSVGHPSDGGAARVSTPPRERGQYDRQRLLGTFDGPARAIRCAISIREELRQLGIEIRIGLHTGDCELLGDDISGVAVHIGARVEAKAMPGKVLVSSTVKDLVVGSGLPFEDRGTHTLKGIPDEWHLFAVAN